MINLVGGATFTIQWECDFVHKSVRFHVEYTGVGWIGFGLSPDGHMVQKNAGPMSDVVIYKPGDGKPADGTLAEYELKTATPDGVVEYPIQSQGVNPTNGNQVDGVTSMTFKRTWAGVSQNTSNSTAGKYMHNMVYQEHVNTYIWAYGENNVFSKHVNQGTLQINFLAEPTKKRPSYMFELVHGGLMFIGLGLLLPLGAMFANSQKQNYYAGRWLVIHKRLQYAAYILGVVGIALAFYFTEAAGGPHLTSLHGAAGIGIFGLLTIQIVIAATRPKSSASNEGGDSEAWRYWHVWVGWFNITGVVAVIALGIQHLPLYIENKEQVKIWSGSQIHFNFAAEVYGGVMGVVLFAFGVSSYCRSRQTVRSYSMGPQYVSGQGYYYEND